MLHRLAEVDGVDRRHVVAQRLKNKCDNFVSDVTCQLPAVCRQWMDIPVYNLRCQRDNGPEGRPTWLAIAKTRCSNAMMRPTIEKSQKQRKRKKSRKRKMRDEELELI